MKKKRMKKETRLTLVAAAIVAAVIAVDQCAKHAVMACLALDESIDLIPGVLRLTYIRNAGAAFGMLKNARWLFLIVSTAVIAAAVWFLIFYHRKTRLLNCAVAMITGGGISNMIDRLFYGETFAGGTVVDFLDFCAFPNLWCWIFNVADAAVVIGTGLLILYLILDIIKESKTAHGETNHADGGNT